MLIDDLREINIHFNGNKIRDAIVFRINERADDFGVGQVRDELEPLPSLLPYNNMVIHYDGFCLWYLSRETPTEIFIDCSMFSSADIDHYSKNDMPDIVFSSSVDKKTYECTGMNAYYPSIRQNEFMTFDRQRNPKSPSYGESKENLSGLDDLIANAYKYLQAFLNILSCKNIKTELETPDEKIQKKRAAKGRLPLVSFYTLKIQNIGHDAESTSSGLWSNRVHFCRGHMREYKAEAPLFGRIVGRFWIPPHVRGDKNKGIIIKDYEVNTKKDKQEAF